MVATECAIEVKSYGAISRGSTGSSTRRITRFALVTALATVFCGAIVCKYLSSQQLDTQVLVPKILSTSSLQTDIIALRHAAEARAGAVLEHVSEAADTEDTDAASHKVELPPAAVELDKQIVVEEQAIKDAEVQDANAEHVVNMDTVKASELTALDNLFRDEATHMHAPDPELVQEKAIADRALSAAKKGLAASMGTLKSLEAQMSHLLMLVGVQGAVENQMADDKMQTDIIVQRKQALLARLADNQQKVAVLQQKVNEVKIQEQVDSTILSKLRDSQKNDKDTLNQLAHVEMLLKNDKDLVAKLTSEDMHLEKERLRLDGQIVEQELLKRGLEDQGTREVAEVEALQGPHGGAEAIKWVETPASDEEEKKDVTVAPSALSSSSSQAAHSSSPSVAAHFSSSSSKAV